MRKTIEIPILTFDKENKNKRTFPSGKNPLARNETCMKHNPYFRDICRCSTCKASNPYRLIVEGGK